MIMEILYGAIGRTFPPMLKKGYETKQNGERPDPTNPFGNPLGFGLALLLFGRRFWRYSQSPHGARILTVLAGFPWVVPGQSLF